MNEPSKLEIFGEYILNRLDELLVDDYSYKDSLLIPYKTSFDSYNRYIYIIEIREEYLSILSNINNYFKSAAIVALNEAECRNIAQHIMRGNETKYNFTNNKLTENLLINNCIWLSNTHTKCKKLANAGYYYKSHINTWIYIS
mgnify:CR=1 FL=1|tara:strand:- start:154 stop:582 length:429 start_codon:yes stop_codon:yes gene_type:complete